jgi:hypothetical protein
LLIGPVVNSTVGGRCGIPKELVPPGRYTLDPRLDSDQPTENSASRVDRILYVCGPLGIALLKQLRYLIGTHLSTRFDQQVLNSVRPIPRGLLGCTFFIRRRSSLVLRARRRKPEIAGKSFHASAESRNALLKLLHLGAKFF